MKPILQKTVFLFLALIGRCLSAEITERADFAREQDYATSLSLIRIISPQQFQQNEPNSPHSNIDLPTEEDLRKKSALGRKMPQDLQPKRTQVVVVIDVFRAFTTACYVLADKPASYRLATKSDAISQLASPFSDPFLIGKAEKGAILAYNIPNSPTRVKERQIAGRHVLHRTEGGANGVLMAKDTDIILAAGLVNADATARYIRKLLNPKVTLLPMGHEGTTPSLEDGICAQYIQAKLQGRTIDLVQHHAALKEGSGKYFFSADQWQYPQEDFNRCLEIDHFSFSIKAEVKEGYAILTRLDEGSQ